jgi:hypothetical protein
MIVQRLIAVLAHALVVTPDLTTPAWRAWATVAPRVGRALAVGVVTPLLVRLGRVWGRALLSCAAPCAPVSPGRQAPTEEPSCAD